MKIPTLKMFYVVLRAAKKVVTLPGDIVIEKAKFFHKKLGKREFIVSIAQIQEKTWNTAVALSDKKLSNNEKSVKTFQQKHN